MQIAMGVSIGVGAMALAALLGGLFALLAASEDEEIESFCSLSGKECIHPHDWEGTCMNCPVLKAWEGQENE